MWNPSCSVALSVVPPIPFVSLHGPPEGTPQCSVEKAVGRPLTFYMMSISPMLGQLR